jgi:hypothetical protein
MANDEAVQKGEKNKFSLGWLKFFSRSKARIFTPSVGEFSFSSEVFAIDDAFKLDVVEKKKKMMNKIRKL